jgi:hypothetical protein
VPYLKDEGTIHRQVLRSSSRRTFYDKQSMSWRGCAVQDALNNAYEWPSCTPCSLFRKARRIGATVVPIAYEGWEAW